MNQRGRKSAAQKALKVIEGTFAVDTSPPGILTDDQAHIWREVLRTEPAGHFDSEALRALLTSYCQHRNTQELLTVAVNAQDIGTLRGDELREFNMLLRLRDMESKAAAGFATKLRLTNQSRYTPKAAASAKRQHSGTTKPWQDD